MTPHGVERAALSSAKVNFDSISPEGRKMLLFSFLGLKKGIVCDSKGIYDTGLLVHLCRNVTFNSV